MDDLLAVGGGERAWRSSPPPPAGREGRAARARRTAAGCGPGTYSRTRKSASGRLDQVVDLADAGVAELREEPGLAEEAGLDLRAHAVVAAQSLDRHPAVEPRVVAEEDLAHPAGAEARFEADAADLGADPRARRGGCLAIGRTIGQRPAPAGFDACCRGLIRPLRGPAGRRRATSPAALRPAGRGAPGRAARCRAPGRGERGR